MRHYEQLTLEQRYRIGTLLAAGWTYKAIAKDLGVHPSSITRELKRNPHRASLWGCCAKNAHGKAEERRHRPKATTPTQVMAEAQRLAALGWSPEQVAGRMGLEKAITFSATACRDRAKSDPTQAHLRHGKPYRKRGTEERRGRIPNARPIGERPPVAALRVETGHWEGDTIIGKGQDGSIVTLTDMRSRLLLAAPAVRRTKALVGARVAEMLNGQRQDGRALTLTLDNGKEFAGHEDVAEATSTDVFFADTHAPWQRGTNENTNGLLREHFPKGMALGQVTQAQVDAAVERLNHRPRKSLGWRTPYEVHHGVTMSLVKLHL